MLRAIRKFPLINPALALGCQTYVGPKDTVWSSGDKAYAVLFESGQGIQHYVYIDNIEDYIAFMRNYGNVTQAFDAKPSMPLLSRSLTGRRSCRHDVTYPQ